MLVGYYLIEAENLDQALGVAKRIPLIRYGRVEVRPVMDLSVE
ncbi:MAG TPA: YciI family protein [Solirubrobacteraceae bacterium]|nr:YciI family protein [Solirubrobacteraceae bacterium]